MKEKPRPNQTIIEVYEDNFISEIKRVGTYLKDYPYIGMDTEFPGTVYPCMEYTQNFYYKYIRNNVNQLKLIQLGITLCNEKGETAPEGSTWQFNLRFNLEKDNHSKESIAMLTECGIDFNVLKQRGIHHHTFAEYFFVSGLILNEDVKWISFNGFSDFAYLLRIALNTNLPESENEFISLLDLYFPEYYDEKILSNVNDNLKGGLNKLAQQLNVERFGLVHQAGSDSMVTADVFFKMEEMGLISKEESESRKNILFGIGKGADDKETFQYTMFANNVTNSSMLNTMNFGLKSNPNMIIGNGYNGYFTGSPSLSNGSFEYNNKIVRNTLPLIY